MVIMLFEMVASIAFLGLYKRSTIFLSALSVLSLVALIFLGETLFHQSLGAGWGRFNFIGGFPRVFYGFCLGMIIYRITGNIGADSLPRFRKMRYKPVGVLMPLWWSVSHSRCPSKGRTIIFCSSWRSPPCFS